MSFRGSFWVKHIYLLGIGIEAKDMDIQKDSCLEGGEMLCKN
jgi:hypothetical protein